MCSWRRTVYRRFGGTCCLQLRMEPLCGQTTEAGWREMWLLKAKIWEEILVIRLQERTVSRPEEQSVDTPIYLVCSVAYLYCTVTSAVNSAGMVFNTLSKSASNIRLTSFVLWMYCGYFYCCQQECFECSERGVFHTQGVRLWFIPYTTVWKCSDGAIRRESYILDCFKC